MNVKAKGKHCYAVYCCNFQRNTLTLTHYTFSGKHTVSVAHVLNIKDIWVPRWIPWKALCNIGTAYCSGIIRYWFHLKRNGWILKNSTDIWPYCFLFSMTGVWTDQTTDYWPVCDELIHRCRLLHVKLLVNYIFFQNYFKYVKWKVVHTKVGKYKKKEISNHCHQNKSWVMYNDLKFILTGFQCVMLFFFLLLYC